MKTLKHFFFLIPLLFSLCGYSQVSNYTFAQSSGTYTAIAGGTNYNNFTNWTNAAYAGTLPNTTNGYLDDNVSSALLPIGFNFVYNGATFTQFGICSNGWISLGVLPTNSYTPLSTGTSNNVISALGGDLIGRGSYLINRTSGSAVLTVTSGNINLISVGDKVSGTGIPGGATVVSKTATTITISAAATSTGTGSHLRYSNPNFGIRYETIGTAPNRTLVVQWTGWQRYTTLGAFGEIYNFQIRLNETTNTINVVYNISGPTSTTSTTFQVGLIGTTNTDFNNRTSTTNWASSTAGTTNASTMTLVNTVTPSNGQTYTWTPPSCGAPTALTSSSVTTTSATISWTAASPIPSSGYQYYLSTSSIAPTSGTTPTGTTTSTSVNLTSLLSNTTYYWWVRSNCGGTQSTWAGSSSFYTGNPVCTNTSSYGSAIASSDNTSITISTCNFQGDYSTISGIVSGNTYQFGYSLGGWITIRSGSSNGPAVASGNAPLTWVATSSGTFYVHYNTNSSCGTTSICGTSTITCTSCPAPIVGCTNTSFYPAAFNAPTTNSPYTIATDQWQEEYNQVNNVVAGTTFQSSYSLGGYITIRFGTYNGTVVATGNSPLTWTATNSGSYFIHYNTGSGCGTALNSGTSTLTCTSCPAPSIPNDLVCNATPITCGSTTSGTTIGATNTGTGENQTCTISQTQPGVWYSIVGNGQIMTASLCGTAWDSKISVFQGTCSSLTCVGGNDDNGPTCTSTSASISWTSTIGVTYYILVHGYSTNSTFSINLTCTNPPPANPTSISVSSSFICSGSGNSVTLTANGVVGTVYWFNGSCGTTGQIGTGNSIVVSPTSTTTYYARNFNNSLFSTSCVNTTIEVRTPPTIIAGANTTICEGSTTQLGATTSGSATLTVLTGGLNGCFGGNMFNVTTNTTPITINSFDITPNSTGTQNVSVYYRNGTYVGNETNSAAWTLLGSYLVFGTTDVIVNMPITPLNIPIGSTYGIYISYDANYSDGTTNVNDVNISVSAGAGLCGLFSGVNTPRSFNGRINYSIQPTLIWTPSSTLSANNIPNPIASPTSTTTYNLVGTSMGCSSSSSVTIDVNTLSTKPTMSQVLGTICPNSLVTLTASGGVSGTGSSIRWYSGINGTGTLLGTGGSYTSLYNSNSTIYVRREGTCNNTTDDSTRIVLKPYRVIGVGSTITPNYCTDNDNWNHWYDSNDEIIFSAKGDFSMCSSGFPSVTINKLSSFYNQSQNPTYFCNQNMSPGEMRFEMGRNWNVNMGGSTPSGLYSVRFYFVPSEKTDVTNAANDTIVSYSNCGYTYKYVTPNGWFWFKNIGSNYVAPQWDGVQYDGTIGLTNNNVTYVEMDSIQGFSGGSGGVILIPNSILPIQLKSFNGYTSDDINHLTWVTESETNTSHFELERSSNGNDFETIGLISAAGNSSTDIRYNYDDESPINGLNYYRLNTINLDGTNEYSNIIVLENYRDNKYIIYPNPIFNNVFYKFESDIVDKVEIKIIDVLGKVVSKKDFNVSVGSNRLTIDMKEFESSTYTMVITHKNSGVTNSTKIIKL